MIPVSKSVNRFFQHFDGSPTVIEGRPQKGAFNIGHRWPTTRPNFEFGSADMNATARDFGMVMRRQACWSAWKGMLIWTRISASAGLQRAQQTAAAPFQPFLTYPLHLLSSIPPLVCLVMCVVGRGIVEILPQSCSVQELPHGQRVVPSIHSHGIGDCVSETPSATSRTLVAGREIFESL
jgi:hypothetical protein